MIETRKKGGLVINKTINWRLAFFSLLGFFLLCVILCVILFAYYFPVVDSKVDYIEEQHLNDEVVFTVVTDKVKLNHFIATKIAETDSAVPYNVELMDEHVQFRSRFTILGYSTPVTINFWPVTSKNGDLLLEVQTFSIGRLQLPTEKVLSLVPTWIELPEWVEVYPSKRFVEIKVSNLKIEGKESFHFRFTSFDLIADEIKLEILYEAK